MEKNECPIGIFCDLSKAFDCVNHKKLLSKLYNFGIRGTAYNWITDFLHNREQFTSLNYFNEDITVNAKSKLMTNNIGVPQGSIISPLLFILYINDIKHNIQQDCLIASYADDTTLIISDKNNNTLENKCNSNLNMLLNWFSDNNMYLNLEKTKYMQFKTEQRRIETNFNISINNFQIKNAKSQKFLGILIDENLNWKNYCNHLIKSLNSYCYLIRILKNILNLKQIITFYHAVLESKLRYGICFWGTSTYTKDVLICQKRIMRSIVGLKRLDSCRDSFRNLEILTVYSLYIFELCVYTYKNKENFLSNSNYHNFNTRNKNNIHLDFTNLTLKKRTPNFLGPNLFNKLPNEIKNSRTINIFKKQLKTYLAKKTIYSLSEF